MTTDIKYYVMENHKILYKYSSLLLLVFMARLKIDLQKRPGKKVRGNLRVETVQRDYLWRYILYSWNCLKHASWDNNKTNYVKKKQLWIYANFLQKNLKRKIKFQFMIFFIIFLFLNRIYME